MDSRTGRTLGMVVAMVLMLSPLAASATNVRGAVTRRLSNGYSRPLARAPVELCVRRNNGLVRVKKAHTNTQGMYFFRNVRPGVYYARVDGRVFRMVVLDRPSHDLPRIVLK